MATTRSMHPTAWNDALGSGNAFGELGDEYAQRLRTWRDGLNELKAHRDNNDMAYFTDAAHNNFVGLLTEVALFLSDPDDEMTKAQVKLEKQMQQADEYTTSRDYEDDEVVPDGPPSGDAEPLQQGDPLGGSLINKL